MKDDTDIDSINHVGMAVRDLDATVARYEAMGFVLTPYSAHAGAWTPGAAVRPLGSGNRCVMFARNYLEILASADPASPSPRLASYLKHHEGAHIICFNTPDAAAVDRRLRRANIPTSGVIPLQRDIGTPDGVRTAKFERVQFRPDDSPEGYIQAARHLTPEYIYQPRYAGHANGCYELSDVILIVDDLREFAERYAGYTGRRPESDGPSVRFQFPLVSALTVADLGHVNTLLPGSLLPPVPGIAAAAFRTRNLAAVRTRLQEHGFSYAADAKGRLVVPAEQASGMAVIFEQG